MEYSRPLGWISRAPDGKFVVRGGGGGPARESAGFSAKQRRLATAEFPRDAHHLIPSSQASAAGVRSSLRSEGSGQSARQVLYAYPHPLTLGRILPARSGNGRWAGPAHLANQVSFSPASAGHAAIPTAYSPRDPRIRTSSPGLLSTVSPFVIEDLSSVNMPSSVERSFPSTVSSPFVHSLSPTRLTHSSREISSSRAFQDPRFRHQFRPIQRINADVGPKRLAGVAIGPQIAGPQTPRRPAADVTREAELASSRVYLHRPQSRVGGTGSGDARVWRDGRRIHLPGHVPLPPNYGPHPSRMSPDSRIADESGDDPHRHLEVPRVSAIQKAAMTPRQRAVYQRLQKQEPSLGWYERPLATSSPPRTDRRVARVPPSPVKSAESRASADAKPNRTSAIDSTRPKTVREDGGGSESSGSDHRPITYTRDRLIGVVERVRSSGLHHQGRNGQPFRNSAPELATAAREPTQSSPSPVTPSPRGSPFRRGTDGITRHSSGSSPSRRRGTVASRTQSPPRPRASSGLTEPDSTYASDDALRGLDRRTLSAPFSGPRSRASVTSASSGRGSSGRASKLSHSRGDSLQGELEFTNRSSSSSGFASRTTAPGGNSDPQSPRLVDSVRDVRGAEEFSFGGQSAALNDSRPSAFLNTVTEPETLTFQALTPGSIASRLPRSPLDLSVDENYEFDSASPQLECQILDKYTRLDPASSRHFRLPFNNENPVVRSSGDRGLSDSELYAGVTSYPRPKRPTKYTNTEARCAALKEEFSRYRRRQLDLEDGSDELESAC